MSTHDGPTESQAKVASMVQEVGDLGDHEWCSDLSTSSAKVFGGDGGTQRRDRKGSPQAPGRERMVNRGQCREQT